MYEPGKSDSPIIVAEKPVNKEAQASAELVERRGGAKGNMDKMTKGRTQSRTIPLAGLDRVRDAARKAKDLRLTALLHHITVDVLRWAYRALKRDAAPGVDGITWDEYGEGLEDRLRDLHTRLHRGSYRAQPNRRHYIPKADGRQRPLGIASLEDKIVQRALVEVLNQVYEVDFLDISYGFRPGRCQHDALDALTVGILRRKTGWILDADIQGFFDTIDHSWLMKFLEHRIGDPRVLALLRQWLDAGVLEDGQHVPTDTGTPQGAVISPLLANIFLHYVLDLWVRQWQGRHARGDMFIVRYADDFVIGFQYGDDAERFRSDLDARLAKFGLSLHPEKTRLIEFGRFAAERRRRRGEGKPETFRFLGFTHICGTTRRGRFQVLRKSRKDRLREKLRQIREGLRRRMHAAIPAQAAWLCTIIRGVFAYHAVPNNYPALSSFLYQVKRIWLATLRRRSDKDHTTWAWFGPLADRLLPKARILHPWPTDRYDAKHPRQEPYAGMPHVRICAGGVQ